MKRVKLLIIIGVGCIAVYGFWRIIINYIIKPKATAEKVNISFNRAYINLQPSQSTEFALVLYAENQKKISGIDLIIDYDDEQDLIESVALSNLVPSDYFTDKILEENQPNKSETGLKKTYRLVMTASRPLSDLSSQLLLTFSVKAKGNLGTTALELRISDMQVTGDVADNQFEIASTNNRLVLTVGGENLTMSPLISPTIDNGTPTTLPVSPTIIGNPTVTLTISPSPSIAGQNLHFRLRFQGVLSPPKDQAQQSIPVLITIVNAVTGISYDIGEVIFNYDHQPPMGMDNTWIGSAKYQLTAGDNYLIYLKGNKHLRKKICDTMPTESPPGTYVCDTEKLIISGDDQFFDFSKVLLLAGDLPEQDGIINAVDLALVRNNLGRTDREILQQADLNFDGVVDTQDYSLILASLAVRTDEQ